MKTSFNELINQGEKPILVDFFATWCGPCKMMSPVLEEMAQDYQDKVKIIKIDVDKNPKIAEQYQVRGVPTFVLFKNGNVLWRKSGAMSKNDFKNQLVNFI